MHMLAGRSKERALTTAIAAGLIGLPAPVVDAPPGPTGPPEGRGFARALDRATAPPSEASPTQGAPPPEKAVAAPAGDASYEAGAAASVQQSPPSAPDVDVAEEEGPTSMPDRPAGAVEGERDAVVLDASALEAMMAVVLFRPVPESPETDAPPASPSVLAQHAVGLKPVALATPALRSVEAAPATAEATPILAPARGVPNLEVSPAIPDRDSGASTGRPIAGVAEARDALQWSDGTGFVDATVPSPETPAAAVQVVTLAAQRITTRSKAVGGYPDADAIPAFDGEVAIVTMEASDSSMAPPPTPAAAPGETVSSPLGLLEGISGDEAVLVSRLDARGADGGDVEAPHVEGVSARPVSVSGQTPVGDLPGATSVAAAKVSGVQSMPLATQVAETVRAAVLRGDHEIRLLLNPGDLGQIDIRITEQGGVLRLQLDASRSPTRDLLAREMPALQQALEARDLRVERIQVSHSGPASADGSGAAWQQGFGGQRQHQERDGSPAWSPVANLAQSADGEREARRAPRIIRHHGTLDRVA